MSTTYQAAYDQFLPLAMQVPEASVRAFRGDVRILLVNVRLGVQAVLGSAQQVAFVQTHLPKLPIAELVELPNLARALVFACGKVVARRKSDGSIEAALNRVADLRTPMLDQAEVLARMGKLDKDVVAQIRKGKGKYDRARDGLDLARVYTENAATIAGLHPFSSSDIESLQQDSEWLLEHLLPGGARKELATKSDEAAVRDRLWTLISERYGHLRKIGHYVYGDELELYTPKLQSRVSPKALEEVEKETPTMPVVVN